MRGYIQVDGDGVKTYRQLLNELWNKIDYAKINRRTTILRFNSHVVPITYVTSSTMFFSGNEPALNNAAPLNRLIIRSFIVSNTLSSCARLEHDIIPNTSSIVSFTDNSLDTVASTYHIYIYY